MSNFDPLDTNSDAFLAGVVQILGLPADFTYADMNSYQLTAVTDDQVAQLQTLVNADAAFRISNSILPYDWSKQVLRLYFGIHNITVTTP